MYSDIYISCFIESLPGAALSVCRTTFFCFVCAELIEDLGGARNVKFGTQISNNEPRREFEDLSEMFTPRRDR